MIVGLQARFVFVCTIFVLLTSPAVAEDKPLINQDVIKMASAGLSEQLIISKIKQAGRVDFKLDVDDLLTLRKAGVSEKVVQAMLDRTSGPGWASGSNSDSVKPQQPANSADPWANMQEDLGFEVIKVAMVSDEGTFPLRLLRGESSSTGFGPYRNMFMDYPGLHARVRTRKHHPSLLVKSSAPLSGGRYFVAKLDVDDDDGVRSLKVSSAKSRLKAIFGSDRGFMEPDPDWVVAFDSSEEGPDLWRVTFKADLVPGEYGWYVDLGNGAQQAGLFDFGVD